LNGLAALSSWILGLLMAFILPGLVLWVNGLTYTLSMNLRECRLGRTRRASYDVIVAAKEEPVELVRRLAWAVSGLNPPPRRLIIAWDGEGLDEARRAAEEAARGVEVIVFRAGCRSKACAVNKALSHVSSEYVVILDIGDEPGSRDYGARATACRVVVPRWEPQRPLNMFEEAVALLVSYGSRILYTGRCRLGLPVYFLGSGSSASTRTLRAMGGLPDEVLEDVGFGLELLAAGIKPCYGEEHVLYVGLPPSYAGFRKQQARWAMGAAKLLRRLGSLGLEGRARLDAALYLSQYLLSSLQLPGLILLALQPPPLHPLLACLGFWAAGMALAGTGLYVHASKEMGLGARKAFFASARASAVSMALTPVLLAYSIRGLLGIRVGFIKTPKKRGSRLIPVSEAVALAACLAALAFGPPSPVKLLVLMYPVSVAYVAVRLRKWLS